MDWQFIPRARTRWRPLSDIGLDIIRHGDLRDIPKNSNARTWEVIQQKIIKHYMNPLHIYCRMRDMGIAKGTAMFLCRIYECCFFKGFLTGSLAVLRREGERQRPYEIDRNCFDTLAAILLIVLLSILDAFFTLDLVSHGAVELNPVMAYYLDHGPLVFFGVKYLLTCASILLILLIKDIHFIKTKVQTKTLFVLLIIPLALVVQWELYLIFSVNK